MKEPIACSVWYDEDPDCKHRNEPKRPSDLVIRMVSGQTYAIRCGSWREAKELSRRLTARVADAYTPGVYGSNKPTINFDLETCHGDFLTLIATNIESMEIVPAEVHR